MYNRYIPQSDGTYRRSTVIDTKPPEPKADPPETPCPPPPPPKPQQPCPPPKQEGKPSQAGDFLRNLLPKNMDTGDLLILLLLLLMAGDCREDRNTALLTLAIYLFL